ncbi:unnamed protein product [Oikopleura dioica]|uniref:Integrase catalytic domain-containing protein n=1 Tax=Oikopleura dioica TaxID=34765 RepID=E4X8I4_OIKDI|nr:unnamed protein product [Oikopleura dioica]
MADLIDYQKDSYHNKGFNWVLLIIDCFTKFVWTVPLKKKDGPKCANGLNDIFQEFTEWPNSLITDEGKEFYNKDVRKILERYGIHHYSIKTKMKASIAERAIRTLKSKIHKCLVKNNSKSWIEFLQKITAGYNGTYHSSIKMEPKSVNESNRKEVFASLFPEIDNVVTPRLKIGNIVRVKINKELFEKGFTRNWTTELYKIIDIRQRAGIVWYKIADLEDYVTSAYQMEGYYDNEIYEYLANKTDKEEVKLLRRPQCLHDSKLKKYIYELVFFPSNGFCLDNKPLPLNTTMKLKFNRLRSEYSTVHIGSTSEGQKAHQGQPLEITDCYALCEYVSSPAMRNYFTRIKSKPISYKYQEVTVSTRDIPENTNNITLHNIKGGNTPAYFFFALTQTDSFQGSMSKETTSFGFHADLQNINLTLNGQSCVGYPMRITNELPIWPYYRLMDILDRLVSPSTPNTIALDSFKKSAIFGHEFMASEESQGWMNLYLDFKEATKNAQTLVMWSVHKVKVTIDEHGQVEKEIL